MIFINHGYKMTELKCVKLTENLHDQYRLAGLLQQKCYVQGWKVRDNGMETKQNELEWAFQKKMERQCS